MYSSTDCSKGVGSVRSSPSIMKSPDARTAWMASGVSGWRATAAWRSGPRAGVEHASRLDETATEQCVHGCWIRRTAAVRAGDRLVSEDLAEAHARGPEPTTITRSAYWGNASRRSGLVIAAGT